VLAQVPTVDDDVSEPDGDVTLSVASGTGYTVTSTKTVTARQTFNMRELFGADSVSVMVRDNDDAIVVALGGGGQVTEAVSSSSASISVVLARQRSTGEVFRVPLVLSGTGVQAGDLVLSVASGTGVTIEGASTLTPVVVFTGAGSGRATLSATAGDDSDTVHEQVQVSLGTLSAVLVADSTASMVQVAITDDDGDAAVVASAGALIVAEGAEATYTVRLTSQPTGNNTVTVTPTVTDAAFATVTPTSVTFSSANWDRPLMFTVAGADDSVDNTGGSRSTEITHAVASADTGYQNVTGPKTALTVTDTQPTVVSIVNTGKSTATEGEWLHDGLMRETFCKADDLCYVSETSYTGIEIRLSRELEFAGERLEVPIRISGTNVTPEDVSATFIWQGARRGLALEGNFESGRAAANPGVVWEHADSLYKPTHDTSKWAWGINAFRDLPLQDVVQQYSRRLVDLSTLELAAVFDHSELSSDQNPPTTCSLSEYVCAKRPEVGLLILSFNDDSLGEGAAEQVTVEIGDAAQFAARSASNLAGGAVPHDTANSVTITVNDNDPSVIPAALDVEIFEGTSSVITPVRGHTLWLSDDPGNGTTVTVTVASSDESTLTVTPSKLTFTGGDTGTWNTPQTVKLTAAADETVDDEFVTLRHVVAGWGAVTSGPDVQVRIVDTPAGVTITETGGATAVSETAGARRDAYSVVLESRPTHDVTITPTLASTKVTLSGAVTFKPDEWNQPKNITVTAVDDDIINAAGDLAVTITHAATSTDTRYQGIDVAPVKATVTDDDTAGLSITESNGSTQVVDDGSTDSYTVVLDSRPASTVMVTVTSETPAALTVQGSTGVAGASADLTFLPATWNTPQTVTVTGVADSVDNNGNRSVDITHTAASDDTNFEGVSAKVTVVVRDDDVAGVTVTQSDGDTQVTDDGSTDSYTVQINTDPGADNTVNITATSGDAAVARVSARGGSPGTTATLTFTGGSAGSWRRPQTIIVTGVADDLDNAGVDSRTVTITHTATVTDTNNPYHNITIAPVTVTVADDDPDVDIVIIESGGSTRVSEPDGTDTYTVALQSKPTSSVSVTVRSSNRGAARVSRSDSQSPARQVTLTFTAANYNDPQTVTVTAQDDDNDNGGNQRSVNISHRATSSGDSRYNNLDGPDVNVIVDDDEAVEIRLAHSDGITAVRESAPGNTDTYTIRLGAPVPSGQLVRVKLTAPKPSPLRVFGTQNGAKVGFNILNVDHELLFGSRSWDEPVTLLVESGHYAPAGSNQFNITHSVTGQSAASYAGQSADLDVLLIDDDAPGVTVIAPADRDIAEKGGEYTYSMVLNAAPSVGNVVVRARPEDDAVRVKRPNQNSVSPDLELSFNSNNWSTPQKVVAVSQDDDVDNPGDVRQVIIRNNIPRTEPTSNYSSISVQDVTVRVIDDDEPPEQVGIVITESGGSTRVSEPDGTDTYTVALGSRPASSVTVTVLSSNNGAARVSSAGSQTPARQVTLTFTAANYNDPQTVTVTAQDDDNDNSGNQRNVTISHRATSSGDSRYNNLDGRDVNVIVEDEKVEIRLAHSSDGITAVRESPPGNTDTYTVRLGAPVPAGQQVRVKLTAPASSPLKVFKTQDGAKVGASIVNRDSAELVFSSQNWYEPVTLLVEGGHYAPAGSNQFNITHSVTGQSADSYAGQSADLDVLLIDDDAPGVTMLAPTDSDIAEKGGEYTYSIVLNAAPKSGNVQVRARIEDDAVRLKSPTRDSLRTELERTFTSNDWFVPQTVIVVGQDDDVDNPGDVRQVTIFNSITNADLDSGYVGLSLRDLTVQVIDDDEEPDRILLVPVVDELTADDDATAQQIIDTRTYTEDHTSAEFAQGQRGTVFNVVARIDGDTRFGTDAEIIIEDIVSASGTNILEASVTRVDSTQRLRLAAGESESAEVGLRLRHTEYQQDKDIDNSDGEVTITGQVRIGGVEVDKTVVPLVFALVDNDETEVALAAAANTIAEALGSTEVTLTLGNALGTGAGVTVPLVVTGATEETHYTLQLKSGAGVNTAVSLDAESPHSGQNPAVVFAPGAQVATLVLTAVPNTDSEERTVAIAVDTGTRAPAVTGSGGGISVSGGPVSVAITNDDTTTVSVVADADIIEGGDASFTITVNPVPSAALAVNLRVTDTTPGGAATTSTVSIPTSGTLTHTVSTDDDKVDSPAGTVKVEVLAGTGYEPDSSAAVATVQVADNDPTAVTVSGSFTTMGGQPKVVWNEAETAGTREIIVTLDRALQADEVLEVPLVIDGATLGTNISLALESPAPTGVTFAGRSVTFTGSSGNTTKDATLEVTLLADNTDTNDEIVSVSLPTKWPTTTVPSATTTVQGGATGSGSLSFRVIDDDKPAVAGVQLSVERMKLTEGGSAGAYNVRLGTDPGDGVTVTVTPSSRDTDAVTVKPATLTFTGGSSGTWKTPQKVTVTTVEDDDSDAERVFVTHRVSGYPSVVTAPSVLVIVADDEAAAGNRLVIVPAEVNSALFTSGATFNMELVPQGLSFAGSGGGGGIGGTSNRNRGERLWKQATGELTARALGHITLTGAPDGLSVTSGRFVQTRDENSDESDKVTGANVLLGLTYTGQPVTTASTVTVTVGNQLLSRRGGAQGRPCDRDNPCDDIAGSFDITVEPPGVLVSPASLDLVEGGAAGSYEVRLSTDPGDGATVVVTPLSGDMGAATVGSALTFTGGGSGDWETPKQVAVTPADDDDAIDETVTITHTVAGYTGVSTGPVVSVTVNDDEDLAAVIVQSSGSTQPAENGGTDTYTVALSAQPTATVTVTITSADADVALVSTDAAAAGTASLTFLSAQWDTPQTVTVTGVNDAVDNSGGGRSVAISHSFADGGFGSVTADVTAFVVDDEPTVVSIAASGTITEGDSSTSAEVTLSFVAPVSGGEIVVVPLRLTGSDGVTLSGTQNRDFDLALKSGQTGVTLSGETTATPLVTVTGAVGSSVSSVVLTLTATASRDDGDRANDSVTVTLGNAAAFNAQTATTAAGGAAPHGTDTSATVTITDKNASTVAVARSDSGDLTEGASAANDRTARFTVSLNLPLSAGESITVPLAITGDGVTVDDFTLSAATGTGINTGVTLSGASTLTPSVTFAGAGAQVATIDVEIADDAVNEETETLTVGLGDLTAAGIQAATQDSATANLIDNDQFYDDNDKEIMVRLRGGGAIDGSISSGDGSSADVTVELSRALVDGEVVVVQLAETLTSAAASDYTTTVAGTGVSGDLGALRFTGSDDNTVQTATVAFTSAGRDAGDQSGDPTAGGDGDAVNGLIVVSVAAAGHRTSFGLDVAPHDDDDATTLDDAATRVLIVDDEATAATITFADTDDAALSAASVSEGSDFMFKVVLPSGVTGPVTVPLNYTHGSTVAADFDALPASVFIPYGARSATVTISAKADEDDESDETLTVSAGTAPLGFSTAGATFALTVSEAIDPAGPGVTVDAGDGLEVSEDGSDTDSFTVVLDAPVVCPEVVGSPCLGVSVTSGDSSVVRVSAAATGPFGASTQVVFGADDWRTPQTVYVQGINDDVKNNGGSRTESLSFEVVSPWDDAYKDVTVSPLSVTVNDDNKDELGAAVFNTPLPSDLSISENADGSSTAITVGSPVTATDPDGDTVTYSLAAPVAAGFTIGSSTGQISYSGSGLDREVSAAIRLVVVASSIGPDGTNAVKVRQPVTITVTDVDEGDATVEVEGLALAGRGTVSFASLDGDPDGDPNVRASDTTGLTFVWQTSTDDGGSWQTATGGGSATASYKVATADVGSLLRLGVSYTDGGGTAEQVFSEPVTVVGVARVQALVSVVDAVATEGDTPDKAVITVGVDLPLLAGETVMVPLVFAGGTAPTDFTVAKDSSSPSNVTVSSAGVVTFTGPVEGLARVEVTAVADSDTVSEELSVSVGTMTANGPAITRARLVGTVVGSGVVTLAEPPSPGVTITETGNGTTVAEDGGTDSYTVVLNTQPTHTVTITVTSGTPTAALVDGPDAGTTVSASEMLTFTTSNWATPQTVTVTGQNDSVDNPNNQRTAAISHTAASSDGDYSGVSIASVSVTVADDDDPVVQRVRLSAQSVSVVEGATASYSVVLTSPPAQDVTVTPESSDSGVVTVSGVLTFTSRDWETAQSVTVTATDDAADRPGVVAQRETITHRVVSDDPVFEVAPVGLVTVNVADDDATEVSLARSGSGPIVEAPRATDRAVEFTVTLGRVLVVGERVDVPLVLSGSGITAADFVLALKSGSGLNTGVRLRAAGTLTPTVSLAGAGARTATLVLTARDDSAAEGAGETLTVTLGDVTVDTLGTNVGGGAAASTTDNTFDVTITDDDAPVVVSLERSSSDSGAIEEAGATEADRQALFDVSLGCVLFTGERVAVPLVLSGTDITDSDVHEVKLDTSGGQSSNVKLVRRGSYLALTLNFSAGSQSARVVTTANADSLDEDDSESLTVALGDAASFVQLKELRATNTPGGASRSTSNNSATVTITDGDEPLEITLAAADKTLDEGDSSDTATATVTLSRALVAGQSISVPVNYSGGRAGDDFTVSLSGSPDGVGLVSAPGFARVVFTGPSAATATLVFTASDDTDSVSEQVTLTLPAVSKAVYRAEGLADTVTLGSTKTQTLTIGDDDVVEGVVLTTAATVTIATADGDNAVRVLETSGTVEIEVLLTEAGGVAAVPSGGRVEVPLVISGDARLGADYTLALKSGAGVNTGVSVLSAKPLTGNDPVLVFGPRASTAVLVLTVESDDNAAEGSAATLFAETARIALADKRAFAGRSANTVPAQPAVVAGTSEPQSVTVAIADDDNAAAVAVSPTALRVVEGDSSTGADYQMTLASAPTGTVTVTATAAAGLQVNTAGNSPAGTATLMFTTTNWWQPQAVTITATAATNNSNDDPPRALTVTHAVSGYSSVTSGTDVNVTLVDDDPTVVTLSGGGSIVEADPTTSTTVTVELNRALAAGEKVQVPLRVFSPTGAPLVTIRRFRPGQTPQTAMLDWSVSGTGTSISVDPFAVRSRLGNLVNLVVTFTGAGAQTATVTFTPTTTGDTDSADETINITIPPNSLNAPTRPTNVGGGLTASGTAKITIAEEAPAVPDVAVTLRVDGGGSVTEGGTLTVTATLALAATANVSIPVRMSTSGSPTAVVADFSLSDSNSIDIASGSLSGTLTLTATDDDLAEGSESLMLELGTLPSGYTAGSPSSVNITIADNDTAGVTITESGTPAGTTVGENGGTDTYMVVLTSEPTHDVTITVTSGTPSAAVVDGGDAGTVGSASETLTFTATNWDDPQTVTVTGVNDNVDNTSNQRTSQIAHTAASSDTDYQGISIGGVTVTVTDDDAAPSAITLSVSLTTVAESAAATTVRVTATITSATRFAASQSVTVTVGADSDSASEGTDYTNVGSQTITIAAGEASGFVDFTLTPSNDTADEPSESISITGKLGSVAFTDTSIELTDDDATVVTLARTDNGAIAEDATQSAADRSAEFTVTLGRVLVAGERVDVPLALSGTGIATGDFGLALKSGDSLNTAVTLSNAGSLAPTVVFEGAGAQTATLVLTATDDSVDEGDSETLTVALGDVTDTNLGTNVSGGAAASDDNDPNTTDNTFDVAITDDDDPPQASDVAVSLGVDSASVTEGGSVTVTVTLRSAAAAAVSIPVTAGGGSAGTSDYRLSASSITVSSGQMTGTITLTAIDDTAAETAETVVLRLGTLPAGYIAASSSSVTVTIAESDTYGITITQTGGNTAVAEDSGTDTYTVVLNRQPSHDVTITITSATPSAALIDGPDAGTNGSGTERLTFTSSNWDSAQTITVTGVDDDQANNNRARLVTLTHAVSSTDAGFNAVVDQTVTVRVIDDDAPPAIGLSLSTSSHQENGGSVTVTVTAMIDHATVRFAEKTTIHVAVYGTGSEGVEFTPVAPFDITIPADAASGTGAFTLTPDDDDINGRDATITVAGAAFGLTPITLLEVNDATILLSDDDADPVLTQTAPENASIEEGELAVFVINASRASSFPITVNVWVTETATSNLVANSDEGDKQITLPAGETQVAYSVPTVSDSFKEVDGSVMLALRWGRDYTVGSLAARSQTVSIADNDDTWPIAVNLNVSEDGNVTEGDTVTVTATLTAPAPAEVTIPITVANSTATAADYRLSASSITIASGSTSATLTVTAIDDTIDEKAEKLVLRVGALHSFYIAGSQPQVTVTIKDAPDPADAPARWVFKDSSGNIFTEDHTMMLAPGETDWYSIELSHDPPKTVRYMWVQSGYVDAELRYYNHPVSIRRNRRVTAYGSVSSRWVERIIYFSPNFVGNTGNSIRTPKWNEPQRIYVTAWTKQNAVRERRDFFDPHCRTDIDPCWIITNNKGESPNIIINIVDNENTADNDNTPSSQSDDSQQPADPILDDPPPADPTPTDPQ